MRPTPGTAQATLLNIFGDIVYPTDTSVPTAAFLDAMSGLDYTEPAIRQAISRCSSSGWIAKQRDGRSTRWRLTSSGETLVQEGIAGVEQLSNPHSDWDGRWRIIIVTIANEQRSARDRLYRALRWDGFGNPMSSVWVSPHPHRDRRISAAITELGLDHSTLSFIGTADGLGLPDLELVERAFDLSALEELYEGLVERFSIIRPSSDEEHFVALLHLNYELQQLLVTDPHIPSLLTPRWSGRLAAAKLLILRRDWHAAAKRHWQDVVARQI